MLLLGDFIHGTIHTSARLEQQMNVVEQIMLASEVLADCLNKLKAAAPHIIVCSCTDNHSRALPDLHESIEAENFGKLITFYLEAELHEILERLNYKNQCDKSGWLVREESNTLILTGLALLHLYTNL